MDEHTGVRVSGAQVYVRAVSSKNTTAYLTLTDQEGKFAVGDIDPGRYTILVSQERYVNQEFGADGKRPARVITLAATGRLQDIKILLRRPGLISGVVLNENDDPIANAQVQCMRVTYVAGRRRLAQAYVAATNDLGQYRIAGVEPGRYVVAKSYHPRRITVRADRIVSSPEAAAAAEYGYTRAYYPRGASSDNATVFDVGSGLELSGIDLHLERTRIAQINGKVLSTSGLPVPAASITLWRVNPSGRSTEPPEIARILDATGTFQFVDVPSGSYLLNAATTSGEGALQRIEVGSSKLDVRINLSAPIDLRGSVTADPASGPVTGMKLTLQATRLSGRNQVDVSSSGVFSFRGMPPDIYGIAVAGDQDNIYVKSARSGSMDITNSNLEIGAAAPSAELTIVVSTAAGELTGSVESRDHNPVSDATVVLVPDGHRRDVARLYKNTASDDKGSFTLKGIAPGSYRLFAWEDIEQGLWTDADFLRPIESLGQKVTIEEASRQQVIATVIPKQ